MAKKPKTNPLVESYNAGVSIQQIADDNEMTVAEVEAVVVQ